MRRASGSNSGSIRTRRISSRCSAKRVNSFSFARPAGAARWRPRPRRTWGWRRWPTLPAAPAHGKRPARRSLIGGARNEACEAQAETVTARRDGAACPCGGKAYAQCCGRFIEQGQIPQTAAELMRSRYTAYVMRNDDYLLATWQASTRPPPPIADEALKWLRLQVRTNTQHGDDATGKLVARDLDAVGRAHRLQETCRFVREDGIWFFVRGTFDYATPTSHNSW